MKLSYLASFALAATLTACAPANSDKTEPKSNVSSDTSKAKYCVNNNTDKAYRFGISQPSFGTMTSELEPKSKFCTNVHNGAELFVQLEKKGQKYCKMKTDTGGLFTLNMFEMSGECDWVRTSN